MTQNVGFKKVRAMEGGVRLADVSRPLGWWGDTESLAFIFEELVSTNIFILLHLLS